MAQETLVVKLDRDGQRLLEGRLKLGDFEFRSLDNARFSVRGEGVVATLYRSGKLVVQGTATRLFVERYVSGAETPAEQRSPRSAPEAGRSTVGSDETGKGDYFGPLVVVALRVEPGGYGALAESGVTDSKKLSDERIRRLAPFLRESYAHAVERLDPEDYNREYARIGNLNLLLADLHARAIRRMLAGGQAEPGLRVVVDQFANESLLRERLADTSVHLEQMPRGEREPAVAAASILARAVFLEGLQALSEEVALDLVKGAGAPVDRAARRFVSVHGREALGRVAKLHFKNTAKLGVG